MPPAVTSTKSRARPVALSPPSVGSAIATTMTSSNAGASRNGQSARGDTLRWPTISGGTVSSSQLWAPPLSATITPRRSQSRTTSVWASECPRRCASLSEQTPRSKPSSAGVTAARCCVSTQSAARAAKKRVRKRPRRSSGGRLLRGALLICAALPAGRNDVALRAPWSGIRARGSVSCRPASLAEHVDRSGRGAVVGCGRGAEIRLYCVLRGLSVPLRKRGLRPRCPARRGRLRLRLPGHAVHRDPRGTQRGGRRRRARAGRVVHQREGRPGDGRSAPRWPARAAWSP